MNKIIHPCDVPEYDGKKYPMFCRIEFKDGELSITGVIGPRAGGNANGGCGQIDMGFDHADPAQNDKRYTHPVTAASLRFAPGWDRRKWHKFLDIWHTWHLNNMKAGCEHMTGPGWDTGRELTLTPLGPGDAWHRERRRAEDGVMTPAEYEQWQRDAAGVHRYWLDSKPSHESLWPEECKELIQRGYLKIEPAKTESAGWVHPSRHPEGILTKACPVCGYKYGSAWRRVEVPADVIAFLESLPDTDKQPAWV